ncbi:MAG: oligosaccharide flippase family protein [Pseudomonadota bacterium]
MNTTRQSVRRNVSALYVLQLTGYVLPLLTVPYLMQTLGADGFGALAKAAGLIMLGVIAVDAGVNTVTITQLAREGTKQDLATELYWANQALRIARIVGVSLVLLGLYALLDEGWFRWDLVAASSLMLIGGWLFPTWLFQGLEVMTLTTICSITGRLISVLLIFVLIRSPDDVLLAAVLQGSATLLSGLFAQVALHRKLRIGPPPSARRWLARIRRLRRSINYLSTSEWLTAAAGNVSVVALGFFCADAVVGVFAALEKIARALIGLAQPFLRALLPVQIRRFAGDSNQAARWARTWVLRLTLAGVVSGGCLAAVGFPLLQWALGAPQALEPSWLIGVGLWVALAISAGAAGQLHCLASGAKTAYANILGLSAIFQLASVVLGAAMLGIDGVLFALWFSEVLRCISFFCHSNIRVKRSSSCAS